MTVGLRSGLTRYAKAGVERLRAHRGVVTAALASVVTESSGQTCPPIAEVNTRASSNEELFYRKISARLREGHKRELKKMRWEAKWIPTCLQGRGRIPDLLLQIPTAPIARDYADGLYARQKHSRRLHSGPLYEMEIEDGATDEYGKPLDISGIGLERIRVLAVNLSIDPLKGIPYGVGFRYAPENEYVRIRVPVRCINEEKSVLVSEGWLNRVQWYVDVRVAPYAKPPLFVTMDVAGMRMKDKGRIGDLQFEGKGEGCETILADDTLVTVISPV